MVKDLVSILVDDAISLAFVNSRITRKLLFHFRRHFVFISFDQHLGSGFHDRHETVGSITLSFPQEHWQQRH